jgi:predicted transglutaminase-like cysteine proteinase
MTTYDGRQNARHKILRIIAASLAAALTFGALPAFGFLARPVIFPVLEGVTKPPRGWVEFCSQNPEDCLRPGAEPHDVTLTPDLLQQLFSINAFANDRVKWTSDAGLYGTEEHWAYPLDRGDCEDIVLLKRRMLARVGWPIATLLITTVKNPDASGSAHAVLAVRTDRGELILDNRTPEILFWYETGYRFLARQSTTDPNVWMTFSARQPSAEAVAAAH